MSFLEFRISQLIQCKNSHRILVRPHRSLGLDILAAQLGKILSKGSWLLPGSCNRVVCIFVCIVFENVLIVPGVSKKNEPKIEILTYLFLFMLRS